MSVEYKHPPRCKQIQIPRDSMKTAFLFLKWFFKRRLVGISVSVNIKNDLYLFSDLKVKSFEIQK